MTTAAAAASPPQNPYEFTREEYNVLVQKTPNAQLSKRSEYEEVELVEDCTLYDLYRQPRAPVTDPRATKTLPVRVLNAELTCPICLGVIRSTMVVMECLHRFCGECIQKCLRLSNRECPSCRIHIPSKRSLRRDENFDALISKIYPDLAAFERDEAKLIEEINRSRHYNNAFTESAKVGAQNQEKIRRQLGNGGGKKKATESEALPTAAPSNGRAARREKKRSVSESASDASSANDSTSHSEEDDEVARKRLRGSSASGLSSSGPPSSAGAAAPSVVNIRVVLHPDESADAPRMKSSMFVTPTALKIGSLKRQIARFLNLSSTESMRMVLPRTNCEASGLNRAAATPGSGVAIRKDLLFDQELENHLSIDDIYQQYQSDAAWELLLQYHFSDAIVNGVAQFISAASK
ncbi:hypothetical protein PybrP1_000031 [[Pythium] brassicae (nom. inval.)]|nr:hypothetical protein PybrP1_000031 [[Pythium] brassicae (nom. inval.)]